MKDDQSVIDESERSAASAWAMRNNADADEHNITMHGFKRFFAWLGVSVCFMLAGVTLGIIATHASHAVCAVLVCLTIEVCMVQSVCYLAKGDPKSRD